jgi:hypothetical protein
MSEFVTKCVAFLKPCCVLTFTVVLPFTVAALPARAQDIFGFFRPFAQPVAAPVPAYQPLEFRFGPAVEKPRLRPRARPTPVTETEVKKPEKPRSPGESSNPVPELLADSTLRPGDMVMFPDGLRVFTGKPGDKHKFADFQPVSQAGKSVASSTRKLATGLRPGLNAAWSIDEVRTGGKVAANTNDVETTGSIKRKGR